MELKTIDGARVQLMFNPHVERLHPGQSIKLADPTGIGIVVQVVAIEGVEYPTLLQEQLRDELAKGFEDKHQITLQEKAQKPFNLSDMQIAKCIVRGSLEGNEWKSWDGRVPMRSTEKSIVIPQELMEHSVGLAHVYPICLGYANGDKQRSLSIDASTLEKIGIIAGDKEMGKSHLAKVLILGLTQLNARCVVIEMNEGDYSQLENALVLRPGDNFRLSLRSLPVSQFLELVGETLTPTSRNILENLCEVLWRDARIEEVTYKQKANAGEDTGNLPTGFLAFSRLMQVVRQGYYMDRTRRVIINDFVKEALMRVLEPMERRRVFADSETEAQSVEQVLQSDNLVVLSLWAESAEWKALYARALIRNVRDLAREKHVYPFLILDEAQLYVQKHDILELISTIRHIGVNTLFITNSVASIPEEVIRAADNRIFLRLSNDHDIKHIAKNAPIDEDTIESFVKNLSPHHALIVGRSSNDYPIIVAVRDIEGAGGVTRRHFGDVERRVIDGQVQFSTTTLVHA